MKRYRMLILGILSIFVLMIYNFETGVNALGITAFSLKEMIFILPPIFILLGLLDIWVPKEIMTKYMGENSGMKGIALAILIGSAAAGPLYGAFPVAAVFMKKGVKFSNVLIFIGAWSTTKIPMVLFEIASLGSKFALTRLFVDIPGIILIGFLLSKLLSKDEINNIYSNAEKFGS